MRSLIQHAETVIATIFFFTGVTFLIVRINQTLGRIPVVVYHSVSEVPEGSQRCVDRVGMNIRPKPFQRQVEAYRKWFDLVTLEEFLRCRDKDEKGWKRALVITFDDGYRNNLDVAAPLLEKAAARATFFLIGCHTKGTRLSHLHALYRRIDRLRKEDREEEADRLFSADNRMAIILGGPEAGGNILKRAGILGKVPDLGEHFLVGADAEGLQQARHEVAGHGGGHYLLKCLSDAELKTDLDECSASMDEFCKDGSEIGMAYPYGMSGTTTRREIDAVRKAGFAYAVTTEEQLFTTTHDRYAIPRIQIDDIVPTVALFRVAGLRGWAKRPYQKRVWEHRLRRRQNG